MTSFGQIAVILFVLTWGVIIGAGAIHATGEVVAAQQAAAAAVDADVR